MWFTQSRENDCGATWKKGLGNRNYGRTSIIRADYPPRLYPQKFALTSPTSGARFVGIARSRTKPRSLSVLNKIMNFFVYFLSFVFQYKYCVVPGIHTSQYFQVLWYSQIFWYSFHIHEIN
jgi:hypothetical protein